MFATFCGPVNIHRHSRWPGCRKSGRQMAKCITRRRTFPKGMFAARRQTPAGSNASCSLLRSMRENFVLCEGRQGLCPLPPPPFEKGGRKLFVHYFFRIDFFYTLIHRHSRWLYGKRLQGSVTSSSCRRFCGLTSARGSLLATRKRIYVFVSVLVGHKFVFLELILDILCNLIFLAVPT